MNEVKEKDNKETIKEETKVSESDTEESTAQEQKEDNNTVEKAVEAPPLGAILDKRTEEIRNAVFGAMAQYGIPASLMDYMLTSVLSEVRDLKSKEYSDCLVNKQVEELKTHFQISLPSAELEKSTQPESTSMTHPPARQG